MSTDKAEHVAQVSLRLQRCSMVDLPAELRLQIYSYLLPTRTPFRTGARNKLYASFTRTCPQIYDEVSEAFYGSGTFVIYVDERVSSKIGATVTILSRAVVEKDIMTSNKFVALSRIKRLRLHIMPQNNAQSICHVRDALFAFVNRLRRMNNLASLDVVVGSITDAGPISRGASSFNVPGYLEFITGPLRLLRGLGGAAQSGNFTLCYTYFVGGKGDPLRDLEVQIRDAICSNRPLPNSDLFGDYLHAL